MPTADWHPAGFGERLAAFLIDGVIVTFMTVWVVPLFQLALDSRTISPLWLVAAPVYYIGFWSIRFSPGKRAMGLRIVHVPAGEQPGLRRAFVRWIASFISAACLLLGYLWMLWDPERRTWHDKAADVAVITPVDS